MKKVFTLSLFLFFILISGIGQSLLTYEGNAFLNGDKHDYLVVNNLQEVNEGEAGTNITWDFSYLIAGDSLTSYMLGANQQPGYEHFPEANIVMWENEDIIFYKVSSTGLEKHGYVRNENIFKYDLPIKRFSFPFSYGEKISGSYSLHRIGATKTEFPGTYSSEIDGYGTLMLPNNTTIQNVLRVKSKQKYDNVESGYVTYRWYSIYADPVLRYPLLSIIKREGDTRNFVKKAAYYANANQLEAKAPIDIDFVAPQEFTTLEAKSLKITAYPNPFIEKVILDYKLPNKAKVNIFVSDRLGRVVETLIDQEQPQGKHSVEFNGEGHYLVYFITTLINDRVVSTKKVIHVNR